MGDHTQLLARGKDTHVEMSKTTTDSPILPIAQIEKLKEIHPQRVEWFFEETSEEGSFRRSETKRVNTFIFVERLIGQICGLIIGIFGLAAAVYAGIHNAVAVGCVIGGTTIISLVGAFVFKRSRDAQTSAAPTPAKSTKHRKKKGPLQGQR